MNSLGPFIIHFFDADGDVLNPLGCCSTFQLAKKFGDTVLEREPNTDFFIVSTMLFDSRQAQSGIN